MLKFLLKVGGVLLLTLLLLELTVQLAWWQKECLTLDNREICLLPYPLLTTEQIEILQEFQADDSRYHQFDPVLGWSIRPSMQVTDEGAEYISNDIGVRAQRSYTAMPPPGIARLAVFGPSFAHGTEVSNRDSWPYLLEQSQPNLEVMNWGVGGYGTDQAFLRYTTQGAAFNPHIVIIAYEEENLRRNVNRFRPFYYASSNTPLTKPTFTLNDNGLELLDNPFSSISTLLNTALNDPNRFLNLVCPHDFYCVREQYQRSPLDRIKSYRFLRTLLYEVSPQPKHPTYDTLLTESYRDENLVDTTEQLIKMFIETVTENSSVPVVLAFPRKGTVEDLHRGDNPIYQRAIDDFREAGIHVLDLTPAFVAANHGNGDYAHFFAPGGHYNPEGNRVVSQAVLDYLCTNRLVPAC